MSSVTCLLCGKLLTRKANLPRHQKTISCLQAQKHMNGNIEINQEKFQCKYCSKFFTRKEHVNKHEKEYCPSKASSEELQAELQKLRTKVEVLEAKLEEKTQIIADLRDQLFKKEVDQKHLTISAISRPTTSVHNTIKNAIIQNFLPSKENETKEQLPLLTIDYIREGAER